MVQLVGDSRPLLAGYAEYWECWWWQPSPHTTSHWYSRLSLGSYAEHCRMLAITTESSHHRWTTNSELWRGRTIHRRVIKSMSNWWYHGGATMSDLKKSTLRCSEGVLEIIDRHQVFEHVEQPVGDQFCIGDDRQPHKINGELTTLVAPLNHH